MLCSSPLLTWLLPRRRTALLCGTLAVLAAVAGYSGGRHLWAGYHARAARQSVARRDFDGAAAHLRLCLAIWPDDGPTHLLLARCARRACRYDEAEQHLHRCRALQGATPEATLEGALLRVQQGELSDAETYLRQTITPEHPDAPVVLEALAVGYAKTERLGSLLECTDLWLQVEPGSSPALRWQGYALERIGRYPRAREAYQEALTADSLNDDARLPLAELLLDHFAEPAEALRQFEQVHARRPEDPAVLLGLARCRHRLGQLEEAQQLLDALLARHSRLPQAVGERGRLALDADRPAEAEGWLRQAVALAPDDRDALYALVQCLQRLDKAEEAHSLGQRLEKLRADLARLEVVLAAVTKTPNDPALRHEAGQICLRYGRKEEGLHWLQTALQLAPAHRPTHETLAEYYAGQGQPELAERHRRLAGLAGPSSPESVP